MSLIVKQIRADIREKILEAAGRAMADGTLPTTATGDFIIEVPGDRKNGDFSSNAAMAWARDFHRAPRQIADALLAHMDLEGSFLARCETAGAGFLNFYLADSYYAAILRDIREKGGAYGRSDYGRGKKINVEFISANPTGPMHMGNARGGALGDCLAAVLDAAGYDVYREFYVNDAGNQIEKFALSLDIRYRQIFEGEDAVEMPEDSYTARISRSMRLRLPPNTATVIFRRTRQSAARRWWISRCRKTLRSCRKMWRSTVSFMTSGSLKVSCTRAKSPIPFSSCAIRA